jgi:hypothetical protein
MMPIAVTYSASSLRDVKAAMQSGWRARPVYSASKLQLANVVTAAMRDATFAKPRDMIRHARARRIFSDFDGALHVSVERCGSGETEAATVAVAFEILSATRPRYHLV